MKRTKKIIAVALAGTLALSNFAYADNLNGDSVITLSREVKSQSRSKKIQQTQQKNVEEHSIDEIREFYKSHPFSTSGYDTFDVSPDVESEQAGKLTESSIKNARNALNFMRYVAGLDSNVTNNTGYENKAQAGTTLLIGAGGMDHTPSKPTGVSDAFYKLGYSGTSASNLGMGYANLADAMVYGWMNDGDSSNIDRAGHRRWCLNPVMGETGFGHSSGFTAMYVFDESNQAGEDISYVVWPARMMPINYFHGPWMVSLNSNQFKVPNKEKLKVTLTKSDGSSVTLDSSCKDVYGKYLNYSATSYGMGPAIIFDPDLGIKASDEVSVKVDGIQDRNGNAFQLEYKVTFFSMQESSTSGGNSSGNNSGEGSGSSKKEGTDHVDHTQNTTLPGYVVKGKWTQAGNKWSFRDEAGKDYKNTWAAVENPYADTKAGQAAFDWFWFNAAGEMITGWMIDPTGNTYYLNPNSDNTKGKMVTGWAWIPDASGVKKCYYFNPVSDGYRGRLLKNTVIDGSTVNAEGAWTVNGVVQTK